MGLEYHDGNFDDFKDFEDSSKGGVYREGDTYRNPHLPVPDSFRRNSVPPSEVNPTTPLPNGSADFLVDSAWRQKFEGLEGLLSANDKPEYDTFDIPDPSDAAAVSNMIAKENRDMYEDDEYGSDFDDDDDDFEELSPRDEASEELYVVELRNEHNSFQEFVGDSVMRFVYHPYEYDDIDREYELLVWWYETEGYNPYVFDVPNNN